MAPASVIAAFAAALLLAVTATPAAADTGTTTAPPPTTAATTTVAPTTNAATTTTAPTTTAAATTAPTTAPPSTTAAAATTATTTTPATTTSATSASTSTASEATPTESLSFARSCPAAAVALLVPGRAPLLVGPVVSAPLAVEGLSRLHYPADGSIVSGSSVGLDKRTCGSAHAQIGSLSLFDGAVTAAHVDVRAGKRPAATVAALGIAGKRVAHAAGAHVPLGDWGFLVIGPGVPMPVPGGGLALSGLAVHLLEPHGGLPAGTVVLVSITATPAAAKRHRPARHAHEKVARKKVARKKVARKKVAHKHKRHVASHEPLTVTPPLGQRHFVFPVVGSSDYVDTYGAFRGDVPGKWHHGDDIFASLGTPVVAVASGTINRVGWERLGGWRLWVRDGAGDEFYYAHLSGYAPTDLRSNRVRAGQVIGFVGNTGDAFTTSPHLHFEVHPRPLLHLHYDGAVDPTPYLDHWAHLAHATTPRPAHPPLPADPALRKEARYVFRELLAARHLIRHRPKPSERPKVAVPADANGTPVAVPGPRATAPLPAARRSQGGFATTITVLAVGAMLAATAALLAQVLRRRTGRREPARPGESTTEDG